MAGSVAGGDCVREETTSDGRLLGDCSCKANTEGRLCDRCRAGHYNLSAHNPAGCQRKSRNNGFELKMRKYGKVVFVESDGAR